MKTDSGPPPLPPPDYARLVTLTTRPSYTIVSIHAEPANVLTLDLWRALAAALRTVEADPGQQAIAFVSTLQRPIFSAGNDIQELYAPNTTADRYRDFWVTSNTFLVDLYTSRLLTVAGIRGACPAGGCALSMCCDVRVMTSKGYIGLNEVALGIHVPKFWGELMRRTMSKASGAAVDRVLLDATLMPSQRAFEMGLVDELVGDRDGNGGDSDALWRRVEEVLARGTSGKSRRVMAARHTTKLVGREEFVARWRAYLEQEAVLGWESLRDEGTVRQLKSVLDGLKKTTKKPRAKL